MNDLDLCLEVVLRSCQPLRHIRRRIGLSLKQLEIEAWFQRTTNSDSLGNTIWESNGHVTDDVTLKLVTRKQLVLVQISSVQSLK